MELKDINITLERYIINKYISIPKLFDSLGIDYRIDGNMLCPFHQNTNTPAAHLYRDENGYRLWCFAESRMYGAWNVYKVYLPQIDTKKLALLIYNRMSENDQKVILNDLGTEKELDFLPYQKELDKFKRREITISDLLTSISDSYIDET